MSEEDIKRIEKKVDLLYKILLELKVDYIGYPYDQEYINKFIDELIPLFGLSGIEIDIEFTQSETMEELKNKLETELSRLKKVYENGDFLAKDENTIKNKIENITDYLQTWDWDVDESGVVEGILSQKEDIINKSKNIYEISLFVDLKKKLGLLYKQDIIGHKIFYSSIIDDLIREIDIAKKNLKDTIEKIRNLGEDKV